MNSKTGKRLLLVSLMLGLSVGLSACASISENLVSSPRVELKNVSVLGLGFQSQTFMLSFDVANPNAFPLPIKSVSYGVKLYGQRFATGETASEFTVPANDGMQFSISVDLDLFTTAPDLLSIVRDGVRQDIPYELEGRLGVDIPLTPPLKFRNSGSIRVN